MKLKWICLLMLFWACTKIAKKDIIEISLDYFVEHEVTLSDISNNVKYIRLDSTVLVSSIKYIETTDFLIFAAVNPACILVYNWDGQFIRKIGSKGNGPGEYRTGNIIALDTLADRVYIKDIRKILVYDYQGVFLRNIDISNFDFTKLHFINERLIGTNPIFVPTTEYYKDWIVFDTLGRLLYEKPNYLNGFPVNGNNIRNNISYCFDGEIHYWNQFNDTIFIINEDNYYAKYLFENDRFRYKPEDSDKDDIAYGETDIYVLKNILESKNYLFIKYRQNKKNKISLYNKRDGVIENITFPEYKDGIPNDIDGGLPLMPMQYIRVGGTEYLLNQISAFELKAYVESKEFKTSTPKYPEKKKQLEQLAISLNENDNPVLMLVKLKE